MTVPPTEPVTLATWVLDPAVVWCAVAGAAHERGRRRRVRVGRAGSRGAGRVAAFWAGLAVVVVALASPIEVLADQLFVAHMVQHLLIGLVAPGLLVAARPGRVMVRALDRTTRHAVLRGTRRMARALGSGGTAVATALVAVAAHVIAVAGWHVPAAYDLAVRNEAVHVVEHASLFITGVALWWAVAGGRGRQGRAVAYLFLAGLPTGAIAALLTLAPRPLYTAHLLTAPWWGLTALEDQQLAGAVMWVPGGTIYLGAASVVVVRWLAAGPAPGERRLMWKA